MNQSHTEYRVIGIHPKRGREVADHYYDHDVDTVMEQVLHCREDGWTDVVIEARTVTTVVTTSPWRKR